MTSFTIVTDTGERTVDATRVGASITLAPAALPAATGWEVKPEGLCRDEVCVPARDREALLVGGRVDMAAFAHTLRAPFVVDEEVDIGVLGASATDRAAEREGMRVAPDVALLDLDGHVHHWAELGRKKKLLTAWASW